MLLVHLTGNDLVLLLGGWSFVLIGIWGFFYPSGMIRWAQRTHSQLRDDDERLFFYVRFICIVFIVLPILALLAALANK